MESELFLSILRNPRDFCQVQWLWYFSAQNFKTGHTKLDSPLGKNLWNLNYFFQYCIIEESRASEAEKIDFSKNETMKFWGTKLNFWLKTDYKSGLNF